MAEDRYANLAGIAVTEAAAGTIEFQEKLTAAGFGSRKGWLIDEIDYFPTQATLDDIVVSGDILRMALTSSTGVTDLEDITDSRVIHSCYRAVQTNTSVGFQQYQVPFVYQFFPSKIIALQRIYLAVQGVSLAAVATLRATIHFRFIDLTDREITELVQATLLQG